MLYHLSHSQPFLLWLFWRWSLVFCLDCDPPIYVSHCSWDGRYTPPYPAIGWDGVLRTVCQGWPQTKILLISGSQRRNLLIKTASLVLGSSIHLSQKISCESATCNWLCSTFVMLVSEEDPPLCLTLETYQVAHIFKFFSCSCLPRSCL
jgi:hypothetical protein